MYSYENTSVYTHIYLSIYLFIYLSIYIYIYRCTCIYEYVRICAIYIYINQISIGIYLPTSISTPSAQVGRIFEMVLECTCDSWSIPWKAVAAGWKVVMLV